ncbi:MAG: hypothetical protein A2Z29_05180 [Chloroflexi bacterium RBG_16_56_11]|nr:MAG: hypothetical protein A2Z29_05180 [Chloroflexi bacterium RBG_16_56_11]
MWEQMMAFLKSWFIFPDLGLDLMLLGIGLAVIFGAIWLSSHWPPLFKKPWLWAVAVASALLTLAAVVFVQIPLQIWGGEAMLRIWPEQVLQDWFLLAGLPLVLLTGLVQEGAKMLPIVAWWWRGGRNIDPRMGLAIGAVAGAGFGIFEAVWVHNSMFSMGWTWQLVERGGYIMLAGFWERFFTIAVHIGMSALAGYGLARGKGWQFYLIAAGLHTVLNYSAILLQKEVLTSTQLEIYAAILAVLVTAWALWLRWWTTEEEPPGPVEPAEVEI